MKTKKNVMMTLILVFFCLREGFLQNRQNIIINAKKIEMAVELCQTNYNFKWIKFFKTLRK